jgi:hypothetical protein
MKAYAFNEIVGKTITSVVVTRTNLDGNTQVFLVFSDGNYFELYGGNFTCASGLNDGGVEGALRCAERCGAQDIQVFPKKNPRPEQGA